jgi:hypothetical protein
MPSSRRSSRLAAVLLATLLFAAAACGTDGTTHGAAKKTTTTTAAPSKTTTTEAAEPTDVTDPADDVTDPADDVTEPDDGADDELLGEAEAQDAVESVNLTIDDLPAGDGWTSEPDDGADDNVFDKCAGDALDLDEHTIAKARGEELNKELDDNAELMIQSATGYLDDLDPSSEMIEIMSDDEFVDCSTQGVIDSNDNPDLEITGGFEQASDLPQLGDGVSALQGDFTVTHTPSGESAHLGALLILVRTETMVTAVTATAVDTPGDEQLLYGLLDTIAKRQADAVATA